MNPFAEEAGRGNRESRIEPAVLSGLAASEDVCAELDTQTPAPPPPSLWMGPTSHGLTEVRRFSDSCRVMSPLVLFL